MQNCVSVVEGNCDPLVVVSHAGPPGPAGPAGANGNLTNITIPSVDGVILVYNGTSGLSVKAGVALSSLATTVQLNGKVDKVAGKGLSTNDFTDAYKDEIDGFVPGTFVGAYASEATLIGAWPTAPVGSYAIVRAAAFPGDPPAAIWIWDDINLVWTEIPAAPATASAILNVLADDPDFNVFTDAYKAAVDDSVSQTAFDAAIAAFSGGTSFASVVSEVTTAKVLALADAGRYVRLENAAGCDITIPNEATVAWLGFPEIRFRRITTAGVPTLTLDTGVVVDNAAAISTVPAGGSFSLKKVSSDAWDLVLNF